MKPRHPAGALRRRARPLVALSALSSALSLWGCQDPPQNPPPRQDAAVVDAAGDDGGKVLALGDPKPPETPAGPAAAEKPARPPVKAEAAPPETPRATDPAAADVLRGRIATHFRDQNGRRLHLTTDKPLYKPGETIWLRLWDVRARDLGGEHQNSGALIELVSPRGAPVLKRKVREARGAAPADFPLPAGLPGGEYTLRVRTLDGVTSERPVIVASYEAPRLKLQLEFLRKAYGAADEVSATIVVRRATGEPLRNHPLRGLVRLDGQDLPEVKLTTDDAGEGVVRFNLPDHIEIGDGLLTVLADDGGLTESVQKRVPIIVNRLSVSTFPEGGSLIEGLPGRVYFEAKNPLGKPADITGRVVDDRGAVVGRLTSVRDGLGRFDLTPAPGRSYHIEVEQPAGIADKYPLPPALSEGCVLRSFDDLDGELSPLRVSVRCSGPQRVLVSATLRENLLDVAAVDVPGGAPAVVYLGSAQSGVTDAAAVALRRAQGVARVTVFDDKMNPLAERIVYRNRRARLKIDVKAPRDGYSPREQVDLQVRTTDPNGAPVSADVALAIVDDTVLSYADDKTGHILSRLYLEPELPGKVEEPNFYFDLSEDKSGLGLDLLMGTRGYRRFEWQRVLQAPQPLQLARNEEAAPGDFGGLRKRVYHAPLAPPAPRQKPRPLELAVNKVAKKEASADEAARPAQEPVAPMATPTPADREQERAPERAKDKAPAPMRAAMAEEKAAMPQPDTKMDAKPMAKPMAKMEARPATAATRAPGPRPSVAAAPMAEPADAEPRIAAKMAPRPAKPAVGGGFLGRIGTKGEAAGGVLGLGQAGGGKRAMRQGADIDALDDGLGGLVMEMPRRAAPRPRPAEPTWAPVRVFPVPTYQAEYAGPRTDFRETIFFAPAVKTDPSGQATISVPLSDAITSFRVVAEGVGAGAAGRGQAIIKSSLPFSMAVKLPAEVSEGDHLELPLQLSNERDRPLQVDLSASFGDLLKLDRPVGRTQGALAAGAREALFYPVTVTGRRGQSVIAFAASAGGLRDEFTRPITVVPRGFPQHNGRSGQLAERYSAEVDLGEILPGTATAKLQLFPSPVSSMVAGLEGLLQEPSGCFEQASSTNYPNVMILRYLKAQRHVDAALLGKTSQLLDIGYKRLTGYETPRRGYEWFGAAPAHEALTAYGLMQFVDMKGVYPEVDREMIQRTAAWLRARRDGQGGYQRDGKALDTFGRASKEVTDAYITYSLTEARQPGLEPELAVAERLAQETKDEYLLALAANSLLNAGRDDAGRAAVKRLLMLQDVSGGFLHASHSITRSGGHSLNIETTSLALLALLKGDSVDGDGVRRAVEWLVSHRGGYGQWGATQSTVLALKALTAYALAARRMEAPGDVTLQINGQVVGREHYEGGRRAPLSFVGWEQHLRPGKNQVELFHLGKTPLPFSMAVDYRALTPANSPKAQVTVETALERAQLPLGESVRLNVTVRNKSEDGLPMTLVRVGLPGGLSFQTWQLKELRDKALIAFYETGPREVNLYLRQLTPKQELRLPLDLLATVPGRYTGPASRAYLYYTSEHKSWADGVTVTITP